MEQLIAVIVAWLSFNYALPDDAPMPTVRYAAPAQIAQMRLRPFASLNDAAVAREVARQEVVAIYDDDRATVYLPHGWTGRDPVESSVLVHELVHHLQAVAGIRYACPQEREALAFRAQEEWLRLFGSSLERAFSIDGLTLLVRTTCGY